MLASQRIPDELRERMKADIRGASDCEVLWTGVCDNEGRVQEIKTCARGDDSSVPALFPHMRNGDVVLHNHPSGVLTPSGADLQIASLLGNQGCGFYIVDNTVTHLNAVAEPVEKVEIKPLDVEEIASVLEPDGPLARIYDHYEPRESQVEMLKMITRGFNENRIVTAEAGTGVGKSFAYLIPAFYWAARNKEKVVISTATINLQQQLMEKDIPLVKKMTGFDLKCVLVKGRRNYLCVKRLAEALDENALFRDDSSDLERIQQWAKETGTGDLSELSFKPEEGLWSRVCSEAESCGHFRCPSFSRCFAMKARKEAAAGTILVVNHHLLFADIGFRMSGAGYDDPVILPPFQKIIFDEAHNLEKSATSFFSSVINRFELGRFAGRIYRTRGGKQRGLLFQLYKLVNEQGGLSQIPGLIRDVTVAMDLMDSNLQNLLEDSWNRNVKELPDDIFSSEIAQPLGRIRSRIVKICNVFTDFEDEMNEPDKENPFYQEARLMMSRLKKIAELCARFTDFSTDPEHVFWIEKKRLSSGDCFTQLWITPLDISETMNEAVYEPYDSLICVSATLSINKDFSYWFNRVGLNLVERERIISGIFPSPFNYGKRTLLALAQDAPLPSERDDYFSYTADFVRDSILLAEGGALVLFTSYQMLKWVYERTAGDLTSSGLSVLKQGDDDRHRLLEGFKSGGKSVLFATSSFWEGVDVPGASLRLVLICRLPFQVPSDPVIKARMEAIEKRGGNSFMEMSLPEAVIRFKQGFGRLMRRKSDSGVVAVLDSRISRKYYGRIFLNSLPKTQIKLAERTSLLDEMESFLYSDLHGIE